MTALTSAERTRRLFTRCLKKNLAAPERLTVSEWAAKYRDLGNTSSLSGRWTNEATPYLVDVMDAFNDRYIREINFVKPTQIGGTEAMLNLLGYILTRDQAPSMVVYPTDDAAKTISKDRIIPSLTQTKEIAEAYDKPRSKQKALKFRGMTLYVNGSTPMELASKPIKYLFFDEIDKLDGASKKEARPYDLARERTRTYPYSKKIYTCSTPTLRTNYVWELHEKAEVQKEYYVPCPHCGEYHVLDFHCIRFSDDEKLSPDERAKTAKYFCPACGEEITDKEKVRAVRRGEWRAVKGGSIQHPKTVSFRMNCLSSFFLTWQDIALEWLKSKDDPESLQNFVNSWLAEPWEDTKLKTSADTVMERQTETPENVVPEWAKLLTGGVDVQENCLYWTIRAWGDYMTSQNIAHGQVLSFGDVETVMNLAYRKEDGEQMMVQMCLIDSGFDSDSTYDFYVNNADWSMPVKGASDNMMNHYKISTINRPDSKAHGMNLALVDGGKYKDMIASRMRKDNGLGAWMVYKGCDREYAEQVTAEHKVNVRKNGKPVQVWKPKTSHADNHYLDCEVYAFAAADILGVRALHLQSGPAEPETKKPEPPEPEMGWINANENWLGG